MTAPSGRMHREYPTDRGRGHQIRSGIDVDDMELVALVTQGVAGERQVLFLVVRDGGLDIDA